MARPKPLSELIERSLGPVFAAQGFASTDILASWPEIVGARLAGFCQPEKFEWPRRRGAPDRPAPGTLVVRVEGAFALELQHLAPLVIERINSHYGFACVGRLSLRQDRVGRAAARKACAAPALDPVRRGEVAKAVSTIAEETLRDALDRLGTAVMTQRP